MSDLSEKTKKHMDKFMEESHKKFGDESLHLLGKSGAYRGNAISTGCLALDVALGVGGIPRGRVIEVYGPESAGKTTLCQHIIAEAQALGGFCAFVDFENALDPEYASKCGVNVDDLFISQPNSGEQGLGIVEKAVENNAAIVVVDSVAALVPRAEIEGDFGDSHMGLQARLMGQALRKLVGLAAKSNTTIIFTNQLRQKIGVIFGNPETTTGGMALRFWASLRLDIRRIQAIKDKDEVIGNRTKVTVKKNKVAAPFRVAEFDIMYNEGISKVGDILDLAVQQEIVEKKGAFYSYGETRLAQGKENAKCFLNENRDMLTAIENALRVNLRLPLRMEE